MEREILFRAMKDGGAWVYGFLGFHYVEGKDKNGLVYTGVSSIYDQVNCCRYDVMKDTLGQYTGLKDKKGIKIFEKDIVEYETDTCDGRLVKTKCEVVFTDLEFCAKVIEENEIFAKDATLRLHKDCKVIGNIYEAYSHKKLNTKKEAKR